MLLLLLALMLLAAAATAAADVAAAAGTTGCGGCWCHCPVAHNIVMRLGIALSGGSQDSHKAGRRPASRGTKAGRRPAHLTTCESTNDLSLIHI